MAAALGQHSAAQPRPRSPGETPSGLCPNVNLDQELTSYMTLNQYTSFFSFYFLNQSTSNLPFFIMAHLSS